MLDNANLGMATALSCATVHKLFSFGRGMFNSAMPMYLTVILYLKKEKE